MMGRQELDLLRGGQRHSRESWKTTTESQGPSQKTGIVTSKRNDQLPLSHGKKKKGDEVDDGDDMVW
jgi:hypothetical protein